MILFFTMEDSTYYFINHTRKEFYFLRTNISICKTLADVLQNNIGWIDTDDIRIRGEFSNTSSCLSYLDNIRYTFAKRNDGL